jgi:hypothetical protein
VSRRSKPGPYDPVTHKVRVLKEMCGTCIFRAGNLMHLNEGRREDMEQGAVANNSVIPCHDTLPYGPHANVEQAVCRGFWGRHRNSVYPLRLAQMWDMVQFVDPPSAEEGQE